MVRQTGDKHNWNNEGIGNKLQLRRNKGKLNAHSKSTGNHTV